MQNTYYNRDVIDMGMGVDESSINGYVAKVFGWMFFGLLVTCISTVGIMLGVNVSDAFAAFIFNLSNMAFIVFIVEVIIVGAISARVAKMNPTTAKLLYVVYAMLNGLTVGLFSVMYVMNTGGGLYTLGTAAGVTALAFGIMALFGLKTKSDLTKAGNILKMGLIGVLVLSVVNLFLGSAGLDFIVCIVGLFVFLGLVAFDTRKIKAYYAQIATSPEYSGGMINGDGTYSAGERHEALASNLAIVGALMLYLDFINIFMFILRLMGGSGRK